jgi:hypothetical protein
MKDDPGPKTPRGNEEEQKEVFEFNFMDMPDVQNGQTKMVINFEDALKFFTREKDELIEKTNRTLAKAVYSVSLLKDEVKRQTEKRLNAEKRERELRAENRRLILRNARPIYVYNITQNRGNITSGSENSVTSTVADCLL